MYSWASFKKYSGNFSRYSSVCRHGCNQYFLSVQPSGLARKMGESPGLQEPSTVPSPALCGRWGCIRRCLEHSTHTGCTTPPPQRPWETDDHSAPKTRQVLPSPGSWATQGTSMTASGLYQACEVKGKTRLVPNQVLGEGLEITT